MIKPWWLGALLVIIAGCSSSAGDARHSSPTSVPAHSSSRPTRPAVVTAQGVVSIAGADAMRMDDPAGSECMTSGNSDFGSPSPVDDVKAGAQVVIADATGKTVALTRLRHGATVSAVKQGGVGHPVCAFRFEARVPTGESFYKITVGTHSQQIPGSMISHPRIRFP